MINIDKLDECELYDYITHYREKFYRIAYSYTRNAEDALDIVQDAVYKALINYKKIKDPRKIKIWFHRILINSALDYVRKSKRMKTIEYQENQMSLSEELRDENFHTPLDFNDLLDCLDDQSKTIILLRYFEDLKIKDIAKILKCKENTVKTRLYTAQKKLRIELEGVYYE